MRANYLVRETGSNLRRNPTLTLASVLTIAVSLALVGSSFLLRDGVNNATQRWQGGVQVIAFMRANSTPEERASVAQFIRRDPLVRNSSFLDQQAAYKEFRHVTRDSPEVRDSLTISQVPPSYRVVPKRATVAVVTQLQRDLSKRPGVFTVTAATDAVKKIQQLSGLLTTGLAFTAAFLLAAAFLLIINTIRMAAFARRHEIEVMKLVGATNWFIRVPFMLEGLAQGLVGAAVSAGAVLGLNKLFQERLPSSGSQSIALLQGFHVDPSHVVSTLIVLGAVGVVLGVVGSGVAVGRFVDV